jgi:TPP-dependent trihydroxycyclohexane-1,2-dione (THcHDO) dehydratase
VQHIPTTSRYWCPDAEVLAKAYPWMDELMETNREVAAALIAQKLDLPLGVGRRMHDQLTGVHKTMWYDKSESVSYLLKEAPFRAQASRIKNLHVISPALAEALKAMEAA